jgi:probable rRNA maturation factor
MRGADVITLDVVVEAGAWGEADDIEGLAQRAAEAAIASAPDAPADTVGATLLLADDAMVRQLNRDWRGKDSATNVLSFPSAAPAMPGEPRHIGDIALAYETLVREAQDEGKTFADHAAHLVVHGVLHLLGQDHLDDEEADAMEGIEIAALARLGIADPYRDLEL